VTGAPAHVRREVARNLQDPLCQLVARHAKATPASEMLRDEPSRRAIRKRHGERPGPAGEEKKDRQSSHQPRDRTPATENSPVLVGQPQSSARVAPPVHASRVTIPISRKRPAGGPVGNPQMSPFADYAPRLVIPPFMGERPRCRSCGGDLGSGKVYCSDRCGKRAHAARHAAARLQAG
jgi:hypothetical protein